jgi:hypothetical protein
MATVTPNFLFPVPQSTDLVKDGATAIAALGTSIDTQFVDLKGGTSGQILAKASNTDLDYSWITNDVGDITAVTAGTGITGGGTSGAVTITNSMATEIAAKGDLIVGTGSQTFDNLTAGANNTILVADSSTSTGLKWAGAWTTWTPTIGNVTLGNGTVTARYAQIGKTITLSLRVVFGSTTTIAGSPNFTLPATAGCNSVLPINITDAGTATWFGQAGIFAFDYTKCYLDLIGVAGTYARGEAFSSTAPFTWGTNDEFTVSGSYEVA